MRHNKENENKSMEELLMDIRKNHPSIIPHVRIVGIWLWVTFPSIPSKETRDYLLNLGFYWNRKRKSWQHCCNFHLGKIRAPYDPRLKYGSERVDSQEEERTTSELTNCL